MIVPESARPSASTATTVDLSSTIPIPGHTLAGSPPGNLRPAFSARAAP
jgi:hypothetical protein